MKKTIVCILFMIALILVLFLGRNKTENNQDYPTLTLKGNEEVRMTLGSEYIEEGFEATDTKDGDLSKKVVITDETDYQKKGVYKRKYKVTNTKNNSTEVSRTIIVEEKKEIVYQESYDKIDNTSRGWWSGNKKNGTRPLGGGNEIELKKYNAYFIGPDNKTIYLTFDEGSNDTYVKEIVEVLNHHNVKATFFLCKRFILDNPDLIRSMVRNGHSVGNHTAYHKSMPSLATKENFATYIKEITELEDAYSKVTGKQIDKIYREPKGEWSFRSLQIVKDLGYKTFFYSADYLDWGKSITKNYAYTELKKRAHNGAIYLIHPRNKANYEAMDSFVKDLKKEGYSFGLVKDIK